MRTPFALLVLCAILTSCRRPATESAAADAQSTASASASSLTVPSSASASSQPIEAGPPEAGASEAGVDGGSECPPDMSKLFKSCIDRYEASLVSRDDAGVEVPHPHFERPAAGVNYEARSVAGVFPQAYISRVEAAAACKNAGKRLCGLNEWKRACQGRRWWTWPYGNTAQGGKCNSSKPHLLSKMFGANGKNWKYDDHFNSPALNQEPGFLAKTGEYSGCANDEGIYDMVGNLHEWVGDSVTSALVESMANENIERKDQPWRDGNGIFMGGFFSTTSEHGPGCKFITIAHEPTYHDYSTGFRCCLSLSQPKKGK